VIGLILGSAEHRLKNPKAPNRSQRGDALRLHKGSQIDMEYRGVEFALVMTIDKQWRWTVKRDHCDKAGKSLDRATAILRAQRFIDELIKAKAEE
jgi:hypothetical protein